MKQICTLLVMFIAFNVNGQNINTIAGNGTGSFSGDGGLASAATVSIPYACVFDTLGNMYFADQYNNRVRKITPAGIISTFAGAGGNVFNGLTGAATAINIQPAALYIDANGNLLISDWLNYVRKVTPAGVLTTIAGNGTAGFSGDGGPALSAQFNQPDGIAVNKTGEIFICDYGNFCIRRIDAAGNIHNFAGTGTVHGYSGDGFAATGATFFGIARIAFDKHWNLYTGDGFNGRVRKIDTNGIITTFAGTGVGGYSGDGFAATAAEFTLPSDLNFDKSGNLYISDPGSASVIRMIDTFGIIHTVAGNGTTGYSGDGGPATAAEMQYPYGVVVYYGSIFICDSWNNRIRKVVLTPNAVPVFTGGSPQSLVVCENSAATSISILMKITDADTGQTEKWFVTLNPAHGTVAASGTMLSTGGGLTPVGFTYTPAAGYSGNDSFTVYVSDHAGGFANTTVYVTINPLPALGSLAGVSVICAGSNSTLTDALTGGLWNASNTDAAVSSTGTVYGFSAGVDTITYAVTISGCTASATKTITVNPMPFAGTVTGIAIVCPTDSVLCSDAVTGGAWTSSNTAIATVSGIGMVTGVVPGTASIMYAVTNSCGTATATHEITVLPTADCTISGIKGVSSGVAELKVYPNPNTGSFSVYLASVNDEPVTIVITNIIGQKVKEISSVTNKETPFKLNVADGVYFISALTAGGCFTGKVLVGQ